MEIAKYWKTIVDTMQDGLMVLDPVGNILAVNPAAERLTGYSAEELIGNNCRTLNCTGCDIYGRGEGKQWCSLFVSGEVRAKKCLISDKNRRAVHVVKNASVLKDSEGHLLGAVETFTDISEIVRQKEEIDSLRSELDLGEVHYFGVAATDVVVALRRQAAVVGSSFHLEDVPPAVATPPAPVRRSATSR